MPSPKMRTLCVTLALLATTLLAACGRYFAPNINLDRYATDKEIVGRWGLVPQTLMIAKRDGYAPAASTPHEIIFHEDGTGDFRSIVGFAGKTDYRDARGSWKLEHDISTGSEKKKKNQVMIRIGDFGIRLNLTEENSHLLLWDFWGDPDQWEFIKYGRQG